MVNNLHNTVQNQQSTSISKYMAYKATAPFIRFWNKIEISETGCWLWSAGKYSNGYGKFFLKENPKTMVLPHRWIWEVFHGPLPKELDIDHLCRVRHCVNPAHMEVVSRRENIRRGISFIADQMKQTVCKNGHPFDRTGLLKGGRPYRWCSICKAAADSRRYFNGGGKAKRRERYLTLGK